MINYIACWWHNTVNAQFSLFSCHETLTKILLNLSQNALKLAYTNVEFKKLTSLTSALRGERHGRGSWGMAERGGGRPVGGRQLESPTHQFRLKSCTELCNIADTSRGHHLYMGCSDVSEFEHIYGQIFTMPSCVYDRLFTWTIMDFNALIVWKTLIDILFFDKVKSLGIDSCLYEIPKNDLVDYMKLWPPVTFPDVYSTVTSSKRRETSLEKSWKHTTLWKPGGSSHYRSWSAYLHSNFDGIDAVLMRKSWHNFVQITWRVISNMGWPHITPVCLGNHSQEPSGDGN